MADAVIERGQQTRARILEAMADLMRTRGAIGRLVADDVAGLVRYARAQA